MGRNSFRIVFLILKHVRYIMLRPLERVSFPAALYHCCDGIANLEATYLTGKHIIVLHTHCKNLTGSCLFIHWACSLFSFSFSELFLFPSSRVQIIPPKFRFCLSLVLQFPCLFQFATVCGNHFSLGPSAPCGVISSPLLDHEAKVCAV
jgi:hypothetical protein